VGVDLEGVLSMMSFQHVWRTGATSPTQAAERSFSGYRISLQAGRQKQQQFQVRHEVQLRQQQLRQQKTDS
jgi:hypothetical protein